MQNAQNFADNSFMNKLQAEQNNINSKNTIKPNNINKSKQSKSENDEANDVKEKDDKKSSDTNSSKYIPENNVLASLFFTQTNINDTNNNTQNGEELNIDSNSSGDKFNNLINNEINKISADVNEQLNGSFTNINNTNANNTSVLDNNAIKNNKELLQKLSDALGGKLGTVEAQQVTVSDGNQTQSAFYVKTAGQEPSLDQTAAKFENKFDPASLNQATNDGANISQDKAGMDSGNANSNHSLFVENKPIMNDGNNSTNMNNGQNNNSDSNSNNSQATPDIVTNEVKDIVSEALKSIDSFKVNDNASTDKTTNTTNFVDNGLSAQAATNNSNQTTTTAQVSNSSVAQNIPSVAMTMYKKFQNGEKVFTIRLDPAELGEIKVELKMDAQKKVTAIVSTDKSDTLMDLSKHAKELTQSLQNAGLDMQEGDIQFSFDGQNKNQNPYGNERRNQNQNLTFANNSNNSAEIETSQTEPQYQSWRKGRVSLLA